MAVVVVAPVSRVIPRRSLIVASAWRVAREILPSEDPQHGPVAEQALDGVNSFLDDDDGQGESPSATG